MSNSRRPSRHGSSLDKKLELFMSQAERIQDISALREFWLNKIETVLSEKNIYQDAKEMHEFLLGRCLFMFASTLEGGQSDLLVTLPTVNMLLHASGRNNHECAERMISAMRGLIHEAEAVGIVGENPRDKDIYKALSGQLEGNKNLKHNPHRARDQSADNAHDTYINAYTEAAVQDAASHVIAMTRRALESNKTGLCLIRPPGHHASRDRTEGFCFSNNVIYGAYAAAQILAPKKEIVIIDVDIHSGDGTIDYLLKWNSSDHPLHLINVLHPSNYPYTADSPYQAHSHASHLNLHQIPVDMDEKEIGELEKKLIHHVINKISELKNIGIVFLSLGLDGHKDDPIGAYKLTDNFYTRLFQELNDVLSKRNIPQVALLEGGYNLDVIERVIHQYTVVFNPPQPIPEAAKSTQVGATLYPERRPFPDDGTNPRARKKLK